ncbi:hypothetical protein MLD38_030241 [Melastoma candidum]|uniref:Uncharacterized protein n=1 Tax=Melastoma candidum TaxID=119954 RepID=A0ACB9MRB8_9MYRT|nr:hypothetical protein MLD38_030241 [Melastoma candidum]
MDVADPGKCFTMQVIDANGSFNAKGLDRFVRDTQLTECGVSYVVISIMGPQSSGKSTLLNRLFQTDFREMDADEGRQQTTKGIWIAKGAGIQPCMLVMDMEATNGRELGQDDTTTFEKQSALFALAISDLVIINMWWREIGQEQASNKPLLKTIFQAMARLVTPRKTTLLLVLRDKTQLQSPLEKLESILRQDIQKIWDSVSKSGAREGTPLSDFFGVQVVALSSLEANEEQFNEEVADLRQRFCHSIEPGGIAGDRQGVVPASSFSINANNIWQLVKENKDLNLPKLTVMVSKMRCEEIAHEKFSSFPQNEDWRRLEEAVRSGPVPGIGRKLASIIKACLSEYETEAIHFDEGARISERKQLEEKLLHFTEPAFLSALGYIRSRSLDEFKKAFDMALNKGKGFSSAAHTCTQDYMALFDEACADAIAEQSSNRDTSKAREEFCRDMDAHVASFQAQKLSELIKEHKVNLSIALTGPVENLLEKADDDTWPSIRSLLQCKTESAISALSVQLSGFEIDEQVRQDMLAKLQDHAKGVVEALARERAESISTLMIERFSRLFLYDGNSNPRTLARNNNIEALVEDACLASKKLLMTLSVVRLDEETDETKMIQSRILIGPSQQELICEKFKQEAREVVERTVAEQGSVNNRNRERLQAVRGQVKAFVKRVTQDAVEHIIAKILAKDFMEGLNKLEEAFNDSN